jgi:formamidopyrimidine-DNA glycosylase
MPELPEVQTVVLQLGKRIIDRTFLDFRSTWPKKVLTPQTVMRRCLRGATAIGTRRFGKHIVIDLDNQHSIIIHLKMTGHLLYKTPETRESPVFTQDKMNGYIHHIFTFSNGATLEFSDMRKFGWIKLIPTDEVERLKSIADLGIDALAPQLNETVFRSRLAKRERRTIGEALLDQGVVAGVGNIYRSEALFLAGIRPMRKAGELTQAEWKQLLAAVKKVLRHAARLGGTSDGDFRDLDGLTGRFERSLFVYGREGLPCKKCGTIVERIKIGQRSAFFCPCCQR